MKIEIEIDENCSETKVIIVTDKMTDEIAEVMQRLQAQHEIVGYCGGCATFLQESDIVRIYAANGKVYAETEEKEYRLRVRLYEIEERLNKKIFVRISNSEIVNVRKVKKFDLNLVGTICVSLAGGKTAYVSRRYVSKIKQTLGL